MKTLTKVSTTIFRAYDIRGIINENLTEEVVELIGLAVGSESRKQGENQVIIARDGRLSGPMLIAALTKGLLASGCDVIDLGAVPTPLLYFATHVLSARSGVMLTGSHNPPDYNGLKIVIAGNTLSGDSIQALYQRIEQQNFTSGTGKVTHQDIVPSYISYITNDVHLARPLKIVIDAGSGIAGKVAPELFTKLGCEVIPLFCEVDGTFPHHHPDPSVPENLEDLIHAVRKHNANVGLAFDGDGDRCGVITNKGEVIWPDRQMMLFAIDILSRHPNEQIIYDVKCSRNLGEVIKQHQGKPLMWKTGHSLMKAKLKESKGLLAGEMSGHIFFKERWFGFDDGLYTGVRLLEILAKEKRSASEIFHALPDSINTPELKLAVTEEQKWQIMETFAHNVNFPDAELTTIDGVRADFADGWGLLRPSNTTPYLILRFEADDQKALQRIQHLFREQLLSINPHLALPF